MTSQPSEASEDGSLLALEIILPEHSVPMGSQIPTTVRLLNRGSEAVRVNSRLAIGYPDSEDRELYCRIWDEAGYEYTDYRRFQLDYRRKPLRPDHFPRLLPGESRESTFDLQEWYRLTRPGVYEVQVVYQPEKHKLLNEFERQPIHSTRVTVHVTN